MTTPATPSDGIEARKAEAEVAKLEAEARKAAADAAKAEADADKARTDALASEAKLATESSTADASARKVIAEAENDAAKARRAQLSALIPDLSDVKPSTLEVKDGPPLRGTVLTFGALRGVATTIAKKVLAGLGQNPKGCRILVTADADLATPDAVFQDVSTGLDQLESAAKLLVEKVRPPAMDVAHLTGPGDLVAALSGALPAVLSLLSSQRTLSTAPVTVSDLAATAAVAGAIQDSKAEKPTLVHDDARLVPGGGVYKKSTDVSTQRQALLAVRLTLNNLKLRTDSDLSSAKDEAKALEAAIAKAGEKPPPELAAKLEAAKTRIEALNRASSDVALRIGLIDSVLTSIDAFSAAIRVVPSGARRSSLATAALYEQLHGNVQPDDKLTHVLVVKSQPGQAQQLIDNRPLWFQDKFSTIVDVSLTYMLIDTATSGIVAAGTETTTVRAYGKIGNSPTIELESARPTT